MRWSPGSVRRRLPRRNHPRGPAAALPLTGHRDAPVAVCAEALGPAELEQRLDSDGPLAGIELALDTARALEQAGPWGNGFPEPLFDGTFTVTSVRRMGSEQQHARYQLDADGRALEAVDFGGGERARSAGQRLHAVYQLGVNRWNGRESLQLLLRHLQPD